MKQFTQHNRRVSLLNISRNNENIHIMISEYFKNQNISVLPYLKEVNPYVVIIADDPINIDKLLKILDPYRKYCESVLMIVITDSLTLNPNVKDILNQYGIADIIYINDNSNIIENLHQHFNRWVTIKNVVNEDKISKTESNKYSRNTDRLIRLAFSFY